MSDLVKEFEKGLNLIPQFAEPIEEKKCQQ